MSTKKSMTPDDYDKLRQEEIRDDQISNRISLVSAVVGLGSDELGLAATIGTDIYTYIQNDTLAENSSTFLDGVGATSDYFINSILKKNAGEKAYQTIMQNTRSKASQQKKPQKNKMISNARRQARTARKQGIKNFNKIPIYSTLKLVDGVVTQINTEYDVNDHLVEYDGVVGSGAFENAMAGVRLNEEKEDDFTINVVANGAAVFADYKTNGAAGNFVRAGMTELVLFGSKNRLEKDKELLTKDTAYTLERVNGTAFDNSKMGMATRVALDKAVEPLEKLRDELNLSEAEFLNVSTILAQSTDFDDYQKQEDRVSYLKMLIETYPNRSPVELMKVVLDSEDEIEHKYNYENTKVDYNTQTSFLGNNFGFSGLINTKKDKPKEVIAKVVLEEKIQKMEDVENLQTGDDIRAEKKYLRNLEQQKVADSTSYDTILEEKHKIKNAELKQKRADTSQEFEWMYQKIFSRFLTDLKASQLTQ